MATLLIENQTTLLVTVLTERHPPLETVKEELRLIRREMSSARFDERRAFLSELATALRYQVSRQTSTVVWTAKQLASAERILSGEPGETRSPLGN